MTFYLILLLEYFGAPTGWVAPPETAPQGQQAPQTGAKRDNSTQRSARHQGAASRDGSKRASEQPVDDISNGF